AASKKSGAQHPGLAKRFECWVNGAVTFDPSSGSGIDGKNPSLLRTAGTAAGVGIGIYNTANKLLNLSSNESIRGALSGDATAGYKARLSLRAAYVANGWTVKPGTATGTLPFTLSYE
ncbi:fimbrial protein, partial [Pseudomonas alloputida]|uniref:fimbrial protein n=1 Tax=Pseudomonas alloputida TaxID=1940621 RepID=UPI001E2EA57D